MIDVNPFNELLNKAIQATGIKSWKLYIKGWLFKAFWGFTSRKFQSLIIAIAICLLFNADIWIIMLCIGGYAGINVVEKWRH